MISGLVNVAMVGRAAALVRAAAALLFHSHFVVRGNSMAPTLRDGDLVHTIPIALRWASLRRGSIVVADAPWAPGQITIKRVVALPGDSEVAGMAESVFVDDGEFFLIGDNRSEAVDSRRYGPVPAGDIIGLVWLTMPAHRWRRSAAQSSD